MHLTIKPHHFLDLICNMALTNGVFDYISPLGHDMTKYGNLLSQGKIDTISFTSGWDDVCKPCIKLKDGICTDIFTKELSESYGTESKYEYNLSLDLSFINTLPEIFSTDIKRDIDDVYAYLKENLTPEIILLNWPKENRVELTLKGLEMAINTRKKDAK